MAQFIRSHKYAFAILLVLVIISGINGAVLMLDKPSSSASEQIMANTASSGAHPLTHASSHPPPPSPSYGGHSTPLIGGNLDVHPFSNNVRAESRFGRREDPQGATTKDAEPTRVNTTGAPSSTSANVTTNQSPAQIHVILFIDEQEYQIITNINTSLYSAMNDLKLSNQITFSAKEFSGMGFFIEEINGIRNNARNGTYWIYYVNGEPAKIGVSNYIVKSNDIINWKYGTTDL